MSNLQSPPPIDPSWFENPDDVLWLMHCAEGPVPRASVQALAALLPRETQPWKLRWQADFQDLPRHTREAAARVLGAEPQDITLTPTTSSGLVSVAQAFPWQAGAEVLVPRGEFPSNLWPWKALAARGVGLREVSLWDGHRSGTEAWASTPPPADVDPEGRLLAALGARTQVLAVSWVRFQDGLVLDLPRLARGCAERRVALVVDGIQGAGTLVPALEGVAAFASGGHKGLLGPQGLGVLWTDPVFRQDLVPTGSWLSVEQATDFSRPSTDFDRAWSRDGSRLEQGVPNLVSAAALCASLERIAAVGVKPIAAHVRALIQRLLDGLETLAAWRHQVPRLRALEHAGRIGSILALHHAGQGPEALDRLLQQAFRAGLYPSVREGYLRIAWHGYHRVEDVERVLRFLRHPERAAGASGAGERLSF